MQYYIKIVDMTKFLIAFLFGWLAYQNAQAQGNIVLATRAGFLLQVWLNNTQSEIPNRYIRFENLQAGNYLATIAIITSDGQRYEKQANIILNNRYEVSYFVLIDEAGKAEINLVNETPLFASGAGVNFAPLNMCMNKPILTPQDVTKLQQNVQAQMYDKRKMAMLKTALPNAGIMTADLKTLIKLLNSEHARLQFAKFAYEYTCDKHNYHNMQDAFRYNSTMLDLKRFVNKQNK
ncbi:MAG: DUF4476 domain-containing protein [Bacteroidetes bacterium]|nr:MAG: DUF4476 domain-containing protein [Bacteroidota bacterium]